MFSRNMGNTDRAIRLGAGVLILFLGYFYQTYWGFLGIIPLATASLSWCPLYTALGLKTCKGRECRSEF